MVHFVNTKVRWTPKIMYPFNTHTAKVIHIFESYPGTSQKANSSHVLHFPKLGIGTLQEVAECIYLSLF